MMQDWSPVGQFTRETPLNIEQNEWGHSQLAPTCGHRKVDIVDAHPTPYRRRSKARAA